MATVTPAIQNSVAHLYVALFGRAPDSVGFAFWTQALADGASLASITRAFMTTPEARAIYSESQTSTQFVTAYYASVMGRAPDASGLAFWTAVLDAAGGAGSDAARAQMVSQIVDMVSTPLPVKPADLADAAYALTVADRNVFGNKTTVGIYYATEYKGTDLNLAKQVLAVVGSSGSTVDIAKGILTGGNSPASPPASPPAAAAPKSFTGTTGVDNFVGDTGNDTFAFVINKTTPANTTLKTGDVLTGGAGDDTLTVATTGAVTKADFAAASISGIENLVLQRVAGSSVAMSAWAGLAKVTVNSGTGTLQIEDLSNNLSLSGSTTGATTLVYQAPVTEARLALDSMSAGTVVFQGTSLTSITLTSSGSASSASITTSSNVRALNLVANGALTVSQITGTDVTVNVSGTAAVDLATLTPSIKAVDASANSGGLSALLSASNPGVSVKGSSGNDTIRTSNTVLTTGSVDAGAGTADRLIVGNGALNSLALGAKYTGFEILQVSSGVSVDMDNIGGISSVEVANSFSGVGFSNLTKAQAESVSILGTSGGMITLGTKDATVDTVNATLATTTNGAFPQSLDLSTLTLSNSVKTLALTGNSVVGNPAGSVTLTTANALGLETITVKSLGAVNVTVGAAHTATGLSIDASQSTGVVTINASAYNTATGANIKGGSGGGMLTGSGKGDTIVGGAGIDTIVSGGSAAITGGTADTLRGNGGADTFVFSTADNATAHGNVTATIQDFQVGIDKIQLTVSGPSGAATFQKGGIAADLATLLTSADNALDGTVRVYVGQVGADSIVVSDLNGTGYTEVIRLTGVSVSDITLADFVALPA